ncbi:winged helix-turn-helix transcriptional regulator [Saccharopolyspora taberi]
MRIEYHLSDKGRDLERAVRALNDWADHWLAADPSKT